MLVALILQACVLVIWSPSSVLRTDHNAIGEDEELHVWSKGTEHQAAGHHHTAEDSHGTSPKVLHTGAADGTWWVKRRKKQKNAEESEKRLKQESGGWIQSKNIQGLKGNEAVVLL